MTDKNLISVEILMLIENFISIIILRRCTRLLFQRRILSLHLAMSDLLTVFFLALTNTLLNGKNHCGLKKYPGYLFINVSPLIVTMMNLDRCLEFAFAMRYYSFITNKFIKGLCLLAWILGLILTYGLFYGSDEYLLIKIRKGLLQIHSEFTRNTVQKRAENTANQCIVSVSLFPVYDDLYVSNL